MQIYEGDKIKFKIATVTRIYNDGSLRVNYGRNDVDGWIKDVEEVIPAPRPLAVGDRVTHATRPEKHLVLAIADGKAWCKIVEANNCYSIGSYVTFWLADLTRA